MKRKKKITKKAQKLVNALAERTQSVLMKAQQDAIVLGSGYIHVDKNMIISNVSFDDILNFMKHLDALAYEKK